MKSCRGFLSQTQLSFATWIARLGSKHIAKEHQGGESGGCVLRVVTIHKFYNQGIPTYIQPLVQFLFKTTSTDLVTGPTDSQPAIMKFGMLS